MPVIIAQGVSRTVPLSIWLDGTVAIRGGAVSDGVMIGEITLADFDHCFADDGGVFTDETDDAKESTDNDMTLLPATETTSDNYYFGNANKFTGIKLDFGTAGVGTAIQFQYWNGTAWTNLATAHKLVDDSAGYTTGTDTYFITWEIPSDWATKTVNSETEYWIKVACTTASFSTQPKGKQAWVMDITTGLGLSIPVTGKIQKASFSCLTISDTTNDTIFQIINFTQGTTDTITYTKGKEADTDDTVDLAVTKDDEIGIQVIQEEGSTEYANIQLVLEIEAFG